MTKINYDGREFASVQNSVSGEVSAKTVFHYHQKEDLVWAEYEGGEIVFGNLIAKVLKMAIWKCVINTSINKAR